VKLARRTVCHACKVTLDPAGRPQLVMDDNVHAVLSYVRTASTSKASTWADWMVVYDSVMELQAI
jgi:hypothetical protein